MDMDSFLVIQKNKLQTDRDNLKHKTNANINFQGSINQKASKTEKSSKYSNEVLEQRKQCNKNYSTIDFQRQVVDPCDGAGVLQSKLENTTMCIESSMATSLPVHLQQKKPDVGRENNDFQIYDNSVITKCNINVGNSTTTKSAKDLANLTEQKAAHTENQSQHKNKDEMEQWVSDTFYSYFPGFNNENKKRQDILRERQLEYQQNFLKHQTETAANNVKKKQPPSYSKENTEETATPEQKPLTSRSDKTDLEIIVNNPDCDGISPRPGSARHKLLQDLRHTEISKIVNSDGVTERNRRNAEIEVAKKKDYQKELMAQIEEKRRTIEVLKEKERRQEEALTRKLQEQLKTMRLEEELEKERMRADKARFDSEQNRLMREHLLTKLQNDAKLYSCRKSRSENDKSIPPDNKVYKYFSNSARHEYRREPKADPPIFRLDLPTCSSHSKECFRNNNDENICPFCSSLLKSYESWCLKCENKIFSANDDLGQLVCDNCKKQYSVCMNCEKTDGKNYIYRANKRNICLNCNDILLSDCNERNKQKTDSEKSFQILELNYLEDSDEELAPNNNNSNSTRLPYSINIDRKSIFHQNYNPNKIVGDENNPENIRHETEKKLSRYLKNYGDLACKALRNRSTQTTPDSASRRDVVMVEENNLSMPLLREMPKMTRKESNFQFKERKKKSSRIEDLAKRWEIPAVQRHTITTNSPKVLTQLGAIRKQLQSEQLQLDFE